MRSTIEHRHLSTTSSLAAALTRALPRGLPRVLPLALLAFGVACEDPLEGQRQYNFGDADAPWPSGEEGEGEGGGGSCPAVGGISYERPRPNVMLLVDRSGSMAEPGACDDATCPSKWQQLLALAPYLEDIKSHARLGLSVFPSSGTDGCGVSAGVQVPLSDAPNVDEQILNAVAGLAPDGRTPIASALDEVSFAGGLDDPSRDNVVVLLTDGQPNCACNGDAACEQQAAVEAVQRLRGLNVPIRLNVVGFGSGAEEASETLSAMAVAAGTAIPGPVSYFQAGTIEELGVKGYEKVRVRSALPVSPPCSTMPCERSPRPSMSRCASRWRFIATRR